MLSSRVKLVVFVPLSHADSIRKVLGEAGAGIIGNYNFCSFSSRGVGRFLGQDGAQPTIGEQGSYEAVEEERIEVVVERELLPIVVEKMKEVHPYEEVAFDVYALEDYK